MMNAVPFEHGGASFTLRLDMAALVRYQTASGETIAKALEALGADATDMVRSARLFWAGLSERMTYDEAMGLMDDMGLDVALPLVGEALKVCITSLTGDEVKEASGNGKGRRKAAT